VIDQLIGRMQNSMAAAIGQLFTSIEIFISALIGAGSAALTIDWWRRWGSNTRAFDAT